MFCVFFFLSLGFFVSVSVFGFVGFFIIWVGFLFFSGVLLGLVWVGFVRVFLV